MAAGCKAAIGCVDARVPVRASYVSLYKWPESDAEFVRSVAMARRHQHQVGEEQSPGGGAGACYYDGSASTRRRAGGAGDVFPGYCCSPRVVDSYSCRQMYLRSYTFSKRKETVPERTMACLGRVRERAAVFPFLPQRGGGGGGGSDAGSVSSTSGAGNTGGGHAAREEDGRRRTSSNNGRRKRRKKKKKGCAVVRRLQEASCGAARAIFRRLLACTTTVDVEVAEPPPSR